MAILFVVRLLQSVVEDKEDRDTAMSNNTNETARQPSPGQTGGVDTGEIAEFVPVALLIIIANGLVLVLFVKRPQLRTPANYVLFSLAACDFMTGIINIPLFIIVAFTPVIVSIKSRFYMTVLVGMCNNFTAISACYHILAATTEKYLAIIWPVSHRLMTRKTVFKVIAVVWVVSFILAFIPFSWVNMEDNVKLELGHVISCLVAVFLLPYVFMMYAFVVIFKSISNQGKAKERVRLKTEGSVRSRAQSSRQAALEKRCLILFVSMATIFLVCWLPWFILLLLYNVYHPKELGLPAHVFVLVRYATSIINPVLYTFFRRDFNTELKSLFQSNRSRKLSFTLTSRDIDANKITTRNVVDDTPENVV